MALDLSPDELLSTTRAVRKRLDLTRRVPREVLEECLNLAQQAPTASYSQNWHFVVVTDAEKRAALGEIWREVAYPYLQRGEVARPRQRVDDVPPHARGTCRRDSRHPVRQGDAGRAHPGRLHPRHRLQAGQAQDARHHGALGRLVAQLPGER